MKQDYKADINHFFVTTFNKILAYEEKSLSNAGLKDISVKEIHIIEAVDALTSSGNNTMTQIAKRISISVGALTTAVNALVRKGYIYRGSDPKDRRIVYLFLMESGQEALKIHADFHEKMVDSILNVLDEQSLSSTTKALDILSDFFENLMKENP